MVSKNTTTDDPLGVRRVSRQKRRGMTNCVINDSIEILDETGLNEDDSTIPDDDTVPSLLDDFLLAGDSISPWASEVKKLNTTGGLGNSGGVGYGGFSITSPRRGSVSMPVRTSEFRPDFPLSDSFDGQDSAYSNESSRRNSANRGSRAVSRGSRFGESNDQLQRLQSRELEGLSPR